MLDVIDDINRAVNAKAYRSALALTLTLPDICGKVKFPNMKVGERYKKWYEDYVYNSYGMNKLLTPEMCYKLRCAFLHSGNSELNQSNKDQFPIFQLRISLIGSSFAIGNLFEKSSFVTVDIICLCTRICKAVKKFYIEYEPKDDFKEHEFDIVDIKAEEEKQREAQKIFEERIKHKSNPQDYKELSNGAKEHLKRLLDNDVAKSERMKEAMKPKDSPEEEADILEVMDYIVRNMK